MVRATKRRGTYKPSKVKSHVYKYEYTHKRTSQSRRTGGERQRFRSDTIQILRKPGEGKWRPRQ